MPSTPLGGEIPLRRLCHSQEIFALPPKVFGCVAFVQNHTRGLDKLAPRSLKCIFVGYSKTQKGYRCFHPPTHRYIVSADVSFLESKSYTDIADSITESILIPCPVSVSHNPCDQSVQVDKQAPKPLQVYHRRQRHIVPPSADSAPTPTSAEPSLRPSDSPTQRY